MPYAVDERRVRYLYEAAQAGSLRSAADKLDLNPSVISRQIAQLEMELGIPLLERHGRGVRPTDAGELVVAYFRQQRASTNDLIVHLNEVKGLVRGTIEVALGEGFVSEMMATPLQRFWREHPGLTINANLAPTNDVLRLLEEDLAHVGLVYNPPANPKIRSRAAVRQRMCAIVPFGHPLQALERPLVLRDLLPFPTAVMHGAFGIRQLVDLAEQFERLQLTPKLATNSISIIKAFVLADLGITLLPAFAVAQEVDDGLLVAIPVANPVLAEAKAHILTRLGRHLPAAANQLLLQLAGQMRAFVN